MRLELNEGLQARLGETFFCVEADSFARQKLWEEWHEEIAWEQLNGWLLTVGELGGRPVCISTSWARVGGRLVMFWEATSRVVDHEQIEDWFDANCIPTYRGPIGHRSHCDADDFGQCIRAIRATNEETKR